MVMAKRKVKLKLIDDVVSRKVCYKKRMKGLWKKMDQLTTLCDVEACAIITGPGDKSPRIWPSRDVAEELQQKSETKVGKNMMVDQRKYMLEKTEKLEAKLAELKKKNNDTEMSILMHHIHHGSKSISDLDPAQLKRLLSYVKEKQKLVQMKININNLSRDPQMLSPPNHPLQNVIDDSSSINSRSDELNVDPNNINAVDVDMMTSGFDSTSKFGGLINGLSDGSGVFGPDLFGSLNYYNGDHLHQLIDDDHPLLSGLMTLSTAESEGDFIIGSRPPPNNNIDQENSSVLLLPAAADDQGNFIISNTTTAAAAGNSTCYSATNRGYNLGGGGVWDGNNNFLTNNYYNGGGNNIDICPPSYYCGNYNINVVGSGSGSRIGGSDVMTTNYFELAAGGSSSSTTVRGNQIGIGSTSIVENTSIIGGGGGGGGSWCSFGTLGAADTQTLLLSDLDTNCSSFIDNTTTDQGYLPSVAASQGYLGSSSSTGGDHDDTDQVAAAASTSFPGINGW